MTSSSRPESVSRMKFFSFRDKHEVAEEDELNQTQTPKKRSTGNKFLKAILRSQSPQSPGDHTKSTSGEAIATNKASVPKKSAEDSLGVSVKLDSKDADSGSYGRQQAAENQNHEEEGNNTTAVENSHHDDAITDNSDSEAILSDVSTSAYHKAWSLLDEDKRKDLTGKTGMKELFAQLNKTDQEDRDRSFLRKGLMTLAPYLERLRITIDIVNPFTSVDPIASTAVGLVKGVVSIAIAICGAANDLTSQIGSFLERIPAIDRCNEVVKDNGRMTDIYNILIKLYGDLLQFYLETIAIFKKSSFIVSVALNMLKPKLSGIISSFNSNADILSKLLESEVFATVLEIKDEQVETLIRDTLDSHRELETAYHNELKRRADEACSWIAIDEAFTFWILNSRESHLLVMFGDMGSGKTMTTSYVVDHLSQHHHAVCAYYCKDDQETTKLGNIYRSLIWQLLTRKPELRAHFFSWYQKAKPQCQVNPTQSDDKLAEFFKEVVTASKDWIFIVLDGLDECKRKSRKDLLILFRALFEQQARLKVFISSRYSNEITSVLPQDFTQIELRSSIERDTIIAKFLASEVDISDHIREETVNQLSERANGSAIWIRIALEYIKDSYVEAEGALKEALESLPSSTGLTELYWSLFQKKIGKGMPKNRNRLQRALETLAIAQRPLTLEELSLAISIEIEDIGPATLHELEVVASSVNLLDLIRPFVSTIRLEDGTRIQLRLVHQSLKELIMQAPPSSWRSVGTLDWNDMATERRGELDGLLLKRCMKYLLFDECGTNSVFPVSKYGRIEFELFAINMPFDDDDDVGSSSEQGAPETSTNFNPSETGLGAFFTYAALYWTVHFHDASQKLLPTPTQLISLCRRGSQRLENWVEQWKRPTCSFSSAKPDFDFRFLDPLIVSARFNLESSVADIFKCNLDTADFLPNTDWMSLNYLIRDDRVPIIKKLLQDAALRPKLQIYYESMLVSIVRGWSNRQQWQLGRSGTQWDDVFDILIQELRSDLLESGNQILCHAARNGCILLAKKLFEAAREELDLRRAILAPQEEKGAYIYQHQSIGLAAFEGHIDMVDFLCQQPGIAPHLHYKNKRGRTVYHQATRRARTAMFEILIQHWPEGINIVDDNNDTALNLIAFDTSWSDATAAEIISTLVSKGKADAVGLTDEPAYKPLFTAIRSGCIAVCRVLIVEGSADVYCAVGVDEDTQTPYLKEGLTNQRNMLMELCTLLPLAVSTEYLFR